MVLRPALKGEQNITYQCIEDARAYHRSLGFVQWHPTYPTLATIEGDIKNACGFVFTQDENKVMQHILSREGFAYCALVSFDGGSKLAYDWDR